jgi:hypothetical protein
MTTAAERRHMDRVASLGCVLCREQGRGPVPAEIHHIRSGQGGASRASHYLTVPLCPECHRGPRGRHGDQTLLKISKVDDLALLALTIRELSA